MPDGWVGQPGPTNGRTESQGTFPQFRSPVGRRILRKRETNRDCGEWRVERELDGGCRAQTIAVANKKARENTITDLCQDMPTTGPPALASCSFASSRRVLSRRRLHIVCLTSCQVYIQVHTVPGIHLLRSLRVSTIAISIFVLSPAAAAAISPSLPGSRGTV